MSPPERDGRERAEAPGGPGPAPDLATGTGAGGDRPTRVRVTGPDRRPARRPPARAREIDEDTAVGAIYMGSLLREQLRLATLVLLVLVLTVGALPLVFHLAPGLASLRVAGVPLAWLVLGVGVYPLLLGLGWAYVRRAERNEAAFVDLLSEQGRGPGRERGGHGADRGDPP